MKKFLFLIIVPCLIIFNGCKKEEVTPPEIRTVSVKASSPTTITFVGNIVKVGNQNVKDYGFIYSSSPYFDENDGIKISLGSSPNAGEFTKTANDIVASNGYYQNTIYARAYITDNRGTAFGALMNTTLPTPSTSSISPAKGASGDIIKFLGKFYSPSINSVKVTFQNVDAKVLSATDSEIEVEIPTGITAYHNQSISVTVKIGSVTTLSTSNFTMMANVKDFSPKSGPVGSTLTLIGDNLPYSDSYYYSNDIKIAIGGVPSTSYYFNPFVLPLNIAATSELSVTINGKVKILPGVFTVTPPQITSISPLALMPNQEIKISGTNFATRTTDDIPGRPMARLGNGEYTPVYISIYGQYILTVPAATPAGDYTLYLRVGPHEIIAPEKIKIIGYSVTGFSPKMGAPGKEVNISGTFIKDSYYYVYFGSAVTHAMATSATNIRAYVPTGVNIGKVKLMVDVYNTRIPAPGEFEIEGPSFDSFSPSSAVAGSIITLRGSGFYPSDINTTVRFGTVSIRPNTITENTITVTVPSNINPGAMKLSIITGGQTVTHPNNFNIIN